jgi:hypothetical protein
MKEKVIAGALGIAAASLVLAEASFLHSYFEYISTNNVHGSGLDPNGIMVPWFSLLVTFAGTGILLHKAHQVENE